MALHLLLVLVASLVLVARAEAWGTLPSQGLEHQKITREALECEGGSEPVPADENDCFGPRSIAELAGAGGYLGAVGRPDVTRFWQPDQHCDDADYLPPSVAPSYPQSRAAATSQLGECVAFLAGRFEDGVAHALKVTENLDEATLPKDGCALNLPFPPDNAKCQALMELGGALHGTEDFYSHSNWSDQANHSPNPLIPEPNEGTAEGPNNPPGLGLQEPAQLLDLADPESPKEIPLALSTGCYSYREFTDEHAILRPIGRAFFGLYNAIFGGCKNRVTHYYLSKDENNKPRSSVPGTVPSNYERAKALAVEDTELQWQRFKQELEEDDPQRGKYIACVLTHDDPLNCLELHYTATVRTNVQSTCNRLILIGACTITVNGGWTLGASAPVQASGDAMHLSASAPETEQGAGEVTESFPDRECENDPGHTDPLFLTFHQIGYEGNVPPLVASLRAPEDPTRLEEVHLSTEGEPGPEIDNTVRQGKSVLCSDSPPGLVFSGIVDNSLVLARALEGVPLEDGGNLHEVSGFTKDSQGGIELTLGASRQITNNTEFFNNKLTLEVCERFSFDPLEEHPQPQECTPGSPQAPAAKAAGKAAPRAPRHVASPSTGSPRSGLPKALGGDAGEAVFEPSTSRERRRARAARPQPAGARARALAGGRDAKAGVHAHVRRRAGDKAPAVSQSEAQISGLVTSATTHAPLAGVDVIVYEGEGEGNGEGVFVASALTDETGHYTVGGLGAGTYRVQFLPGPEQAYLTQYYKGASSFEQAQPVVVKRGGEVDGIDAAMVPSSTISGTVTDQQTNGAVPEVFVTVYDSEGEGVGEAITDSAGQYSVTGLSAGVYRVGFEASLVGNYLPEQFYAEKTSREQADSITLDAGQHAVANESLLAGGQISGLVTNAQTHEPVPDVAVLAETPQDDGSGGFAHTNAAGEYTISSLPSDSYTVAFTAESGDYVTTTGYYNGKISQEAADLVAVSAGEDTTGIDDEITPGADIAGVVIAADSGDPVVGAAVIVYAQDGSETAQTQTDASGQYRVSRLITGPYRVEVNATHVGNFRRRFYQGGEALSSAPPIAATAGQTTTVDVPLEAGAQISGTVTDASTHQGLAQAEVLAYDGAGHFVGATITGEGGHYDLGGLAGGAYKVRFAGAGAGEYVPQFYDGQQSFGSASTITVLDGESAGGVDAALEADGAISGTATDANTHLGIDGLTVAVYDSHGTVVASANTDSEGDYHVDGLLPGSYRIGFSGGEENRYPEQFYGGATTLDAAQPVSVAVGQSVIGIDATLATSLPGGGELSGTVRGADTGAGIEGALVTVYRSGVVVASTTTDAHGHYEVGDLSEGAYDIGVSGAATETTEYVGQFYNGQPSLQDANPVTLEPGESLDDINFTLAPAASIAGVLTNAVSRAGIEGATVTVFDGAGDEVASARTEEGGLYEVAPLPPGRYRLQFAGPQPGEYVSAFYGGGNSLEQAQEITLAQGQSLEGVNASLEPTARISGIVTDITSHAPLVGAAVTVYASDHSPVGSAVTDAAGEYTLSGLPAATYEVGFAGASASDYLDAFYKEAASLAAASPVTLAPGQLLPGVDASLSRGATITGTVTDADSHAPLAGVRITAYDASGLAVTHVRSGADGGYALSGLASGAYRVGFDEPQVGDYAPQYDGGAPSLEAASPIVVGLGDTHSGVDAALSAGAQIVGSVSDVSSHEGVGDVDVELFDETGALVERASSEASGAYSLPDIPAGSYRLEFDGSSVGDYAPQFHPGKQALAEAAPVTLTTGQTLSLDEALAGAARVSGTVTAAEGGAGVPGAHVSLYDTQEQLVSGATTDASGHFTVEGVPPGSYTVVFAGAPEGTYVPQVYNEHGLFEEPDRVEVGPGQPIGGIDAALASEGAIAGTVSDAASHAPLGEAQVVVYAPDGSLAALTPTDATGQYSVPGLAPGSYEVSVEAEGHEAQFYNGKASLETADRVIVRSGQTTAGINVALTPEGGSQSGAPVDISPPVISGALTKGGTLSCSTGEWTSEPQFAYRWLRDGVEIDEATSASYRVAGADEGHTLTCMVSASNAAGLTTATSGGRLVPLAGCSDYWLAQGGGSWYIGADWSTGSPPAPGEEPCILANGTYTVSLEALDGPVSVGALKLGGAEGEQTLVLASTCVQPAELSTTAGASIGSKGVVRLTDAGACRNGVTLAGPVENAGTLQIQAAQGGARSIAGNLANSHVLSIASGATLHISGTYTQTHAGTLRTAIAGAASLGSVAVGGTATLEGGKLQLQATPFVPSPGESFAILSSSAFNGAFSRVSGTRVSSEGLYYGVSYDASGVTLLPARAELSVSPTSGSPGSTVTLVGNGWPAGAAITIAFAAAGAEGEPGVKTSYPNVSADVHGHFETQLAIPPQAAPGKGKVIVGCAQIGVSTKQSFRVG